MMLITGVGVLTAAVPIPQAAANPRRPDAPATPPPPAAPQGSYIFHRRVRRRSRLGPGSVEVDGGGAREQMKDPTFWERPENIGQYRNDRQNVFIDGKSNLVLRAAKDGNTFFSGKGSKPVARRHRPHLGSPDKTRLPDCRLLGPPSG